VTQYFVNKPVSFFTSNLKCSSKIATSTKASFDTFLTSSSPPLPAVHAFAGVAYKTFSGRTLSTSGLEYARDNLRILDPIYGVLKGTDKIKSYRMELTHKFDGKKTLQKYWSSKVTSSIASGLSGGILLDASSQEYSSMLDRPFLYGDDIKILTLEFNRNGRPAPSAVKKQSRGTFARYCCDNNVRTLEDVIKFNVGYRIEGVEETEEGWTVTFEAAEEEEKKGTKRKK